MGCGYRVSKDIKGTWAGYANDGASLETALGCFMAAQIGRVEAIMHQEGEQIPWLEQDAQSSPTGDRSSNISMEPAIYFTIALKDGKTQVIDVELFVVRTCDS